MKSWLVLLCVASIISVSGGNTSARAQQDRKAEAIPEPMKSFGYFAGVWLPDGAGKAKLSEEYSFTPILGGRFLTSEEVFTNEKGEIVYRDFAVFGADPDTGRLFLHAYNTDGSIDRTKEADTSKPGAWVFLGTVYGSAQFKDYRYSITRIDDSHMHVLIELLTDGAYKRHSETRYKRKS
jgi:hypothetical protein